MGSPNEQPQLCERCQTRQATVKYTRASLDMMLCETCCDRTAVQDAYEDKLGHLHDLESRERYDEALAYLDEILEANCNRDHEQWLARSIARDRAMILFDAGRYTESERASEAWAKLGFEDAWYRWLYGSVTAQTLDALGRTREGLAVLEDALSYQDHRYVGDASGHLETLAELSEKLGQPVDPKWQSLAQEVAERHGVEMPKHESLSKAILDLAETIRKTKQTGPGEDEPSDNNDES